MNNKDIEQLFVEIDSGMFTDDRVSLDLKFTQDQANNRYAGWVSDEIELGSKFFKLVYKSQTAGLFSLKANGDGRYTSSFGGLYPSFERVGFGICLNYFTMDINKNYSIFPLSGVSNSKTINCNENGYFSIYQSDRFGFNNPDKEWDSKNIEYLLVGDSYAHGACVNRPNDISSVLRTISNNGVINLGISGNGPLSEYATLREYLPSNVKNIIWIYFEGFDLMDLMNLMICFTWASFCMHSFKHSSKNLYVKGGVCLLS